ncbi:IS701 family transposase [Phytohabitans houttuyneae]|nr:IS701 family transposase [Phytohabitans houttuyneae]
MVAAGELTREYQDELLGRVGWVFARREPRLQAGKYVRALTAEVPRKNGWQIAEWAGDATPDKTQRLLNHAVWDEKAVMGVVAGFVAEYLGAEADPLAVVVLDESGQEKKGESTCGVKRQYVGCAGRVSNAVNIVYATLATVRGHALAGARPYLPREWAEDQRRRARAGVPERVVFKTKPALAVDLLTDLHTARLLPPWATGDEVYGRDKDLRDFCEQHSMGYVFGVPCSFTVTLTSGRRVRADQALKLVPPKAWNRASCGAGSKGDRTYGWAWIATCSDRHHLLVRRNPTDPTDVAFFYAYAPDGRPATLPVLVSVAGRRWPVEEDFQVGKDQFGLDHSQVRLYTALLRHLVLAMLALAACAVTAAAMRVLSNTAAAAPTHPDDEPPEDPGLIPLTVAEVKRLANMLTRTGQRPAHHLRWSWWRRRHQARARWFHHRNRLRRSLQPARM